MARYFFDTFNGETWVVDNEGVECTDHEEARRSAHAALPDIAKDELPDSSQRLMIVRVRDGQGPLMETSLDLQTVWLGEVEGEQQRA